MGVQRDHRPLDLQEAEMNTLVALPLGLILATCFPATPGEGGPAVCVVPFGSVAPRDFDFCLHMDPAGRFTDILGHPVDLSIPLAPQAREHLKVLHVFVHDAPDAETVLGSVRNLCASWDLNGKARVYVHVAVPRDPPATQ
jgi:hypothetical protein